MLVHISTVQCQYLFRSCPGHRRPWGRARRNQKKIWSHLKKFFQLVSASGIEIYEHSTHNQLRDRYMRLEEKHYGVVRINSFMPRSLEVITKADMLINKIKVENDEGKGKRDRSRKSELKRDEVLVRSCDMTKGKETNCDCHIFGV